jgi:hypothetical protein
MRRFLTQTEDLAPPRFILLVGLIGGVLLGIPRFFLSGSDSTRAHVAQLIIVAVVALVVWAATLVLWMAAVRRRQFSIWMMAWQVTLGLALADALDTTLAFVHASIITNGAYVEALAPRLSTAAASDVLLILVRSLIRFPVSVVLIAIGRQLPWSGTPVAPPLTTTDPTTH